PLRARVLALPGRLGFDRVRQREPVVVRHVADLQVVPVRRRRVIALERGRVDVVGHPRAVRAPVPARRVHLRAQSAFLELRLHAVGVPGRDAEGDVIDADAPRAAALAPTGHRAGRRERIAAADDDVADLADQALVLTALVVGLFPAQEIRVERYALLVLAD